MSDQLEKTIHWILVVAFTAVLLSPFYSIFTSGPTSHLGKWTKCSSGRSCGDNWIAFLSDKICIPVGL
ncbi:MAG: hypothetical protein ACKVH7_01380, partial [Alphaproteobacteria bacterium]